MDPTEVEALITPKTKAIIAVHMMGGAADILALKRLANAYSLKLIEDVAQCCGGQVDGVYLGSMVMLAVLASTMENDDMWRRRHGYIQ